MTTLGDPGLNPGREAFTVRFEDRARLAELLSTLICELDPTPMLMVSKPTVSSDETPPTARTLTLPVPPPDRAIDNVFWAELASAPWNTTS